MIISNQPHQPRKTPLPDLVVSHVEPSDWFVRPGDTVTFEVQVKNQGLAAAAPFHVLLDADYDGKTKIAVPGLAPGETNSVAMGPLTILTWSHGHPITVTADCDREVTESKERNNRYDLTLWDPSPPFPPYPKR